MKSIFIWCVVLLSSQFVFAQQDKDDDVIPDKPVKTEYFEKGSLELGLKAGFLSPYTNEIIKNMGRRTATINSVISKFQSAKSSPHLMFNGLFHVDFLNHDAAVGIQSSIFTVSDKFNDTLKSGLIYTASIVIQYGFIQKDNMFYLHFNPFTLSNAYSKVYFRKDDRSVFAKFKEDSYFNFMSIGVGVKHSFTPNLIGTAELNMVPGIMPAIRIGASYLIPNVVQ
jgi:hypothetical protein